MKKNRSAGHQFARCLGTQHRWDEVGPIPGRRPRKLSFGVMITYRCEHCASLKFEVISRLTGEVLWRRYDHTEGYATDGRNKASWRAEWLDDLDNQLMVDIGRE